MGAKRSPTHQLMHNNTARYQNSHAVPGLAKHPGRDQQGTVLRTVVETDRPARKR